MTPAIPFAGLAPDARIVRGGGDLAAFDFQGAIRLGRELRRSCSGDVSSADVASTLVDAVNAFEHDARPACVLVRVFVTRKLRDLPAGLRADLRRASPESPDGEDLPCLQLVATRGIEPEWNDVERSSGHRGMLLAGDAGPMVRELARQLRIGDAAPPPTATFYVADPTTSPAVPSKTFVASYGIRSVVGFGTTAWPGESVVVVVFSRVLVERAALQAFDVLALYTKLAWIGSREGHAAIGDHERSRALALDEIVTSHEIHLGDVLLESRRGLETARVEARRAAEAGAEQVEAHNRNLRRTQRAMFNVIEDLREAREALASKVEERTRQLARANQQLEARNHELEEFVYIASHDLQEPLRTVAGYLQMIERRYGSKLGVEADEFIRFAIEGAQRMQELIESLLVYSRVSLKDKAFEPLALDDALDTALRNLALRIDETGATIERAPLPRVHADRIQMVQLFQNLLGNALKFAGAKPPRVYVAGQLDSGVCTITVRDEGIGFNPKFVDRIFKVFRRLRRDTPGTGIGLAVCKKIAERHGGRIDAESTPGDGSTFSVHFPAEPGLRGTS
jgi:signal transduction histidine kinase